jgi:glutathione-regulated potassium-efflux system ancillary protein KefC
MLGVARNTRLTLAALLAQGGEFGLVVFAAAGASGLLTGDQTSVLNSAIAVSMALTPLAVSLAERMASHAQTTPADAPDLSAIEAAPVIIAGFGRVGQIVGRVLFAHGIPAVVLDHDPAQIDLIKRFGYKVFYGDATRLDLLRAAGAADARLLVNAIDDVDASLALVDIVREAFPRLPLVCRARNVRHYYELKKRGVTVIERETFESSLRLARDTLQALGFAPYEARVAADKFRRHNIASLEALYEHYGDEERMVSASRAGREEFEQSIQRDRELTERIAREGWR